jgi:hypothetical protein
LPAGIPRPHEVRALALAAVKPSSAAKAVTLTHFGGIAKASALIRTFFPNCAKPHDCRPEAAKVAEPV